MRQDYTECVIVLDRSGSMASIAGDVEGGFNQFIADQKLVPGELKVTLVQFDSLYEIVHNGVSVHDVGKLNFVPRGCTCLLDAVGRAIVETGKRLADMAEHERPHKVLFMVITDGYENSSTEFTKEQIRTMIERQTNVYSWTFIYLGAGHDAFHEANSYGFASGNTMSFARSAISATTGYRSLSRKTSEVRTCSVNADALTGGQFFNQADYAEQDALGADNSKAATPPADATT
jgi:hypothetical protein